MAGATVMLSPVWTPIGSRFSTTQMIQTLSAPSRSNSSSYSFHPSTAFSTSTSCVGEAVSPRCKAASRSSLECTKLPPVPPRVKDGLMTSGKPICWAYSFPFQEGVGDMGRCHRDAEFHHQLPEEFTILGPVYGFDIDTDQSHAVFFPDAHLIDLFGQVEAVCPPMVGSTASIRSPLSYFLSGSFQWKPVPGQQINMICRDRICHDGGRIGIDKRDADAFFPQTSGSLGTGVIKFTGLADDDRSAANDQNVLDRRISGHIKSSFTIGKNGEMKGRRAGGRRFLPCLELHSEHKSTPKSRKSNVHGRSTPAYIQEINNPVPSFRTRTGSHAGFSWIQ